MQIFVKTAAGRTISLDVKPGESIHKLKSKILDKQSRLVYAGKPMDSADESRVMDYNIQRGSTVEEVGRLTAGVVKKVGRKTEAKRRGFRC